jgi:hypothetical protein
MHISNVVYPQTADAVKDLEAALTMQVVLLVLSIILLSFFLFFMASKA